VGASTAFSSPEPLGKAPSSTFTFTERVAYQRAIEELRWRHRIWPKENPRPKPPLQAIMSQLQIQQKVKDYLRKSQLVDNQRGRPITASELQSEMERMAKHTQQPTVLRELFAALHNNPFLVAECLARPIVAERLLNDLNECAVTSSAAKCSGEIPLTDLKYSWPEPFDFAQDDIATNPDSGTYNLPEISGGCTDDTWTPTATVDVPDEREFYTAVWTGSEMIVWGGFNFSPPYRLNSGGRYDPSTDSWMSTSLNKAPSPRNYHSAVWTGTEMIVWGGEPILDTGGRYNPITDTWTTTSTANAPAARAQHTAIWTGSEMIIWGGYNCCTRFNTGGRYDPNTDSWAATSTINPPEARWYHRAIWTGSEMVVWGGTNQTLYLNTGGRYNPSTDSWTPTGLLNAPLGRVAHTEIWSGSEMGVWGGADSTFNDTNTGGIYDPMSDSWVPTSTTNVPSARDSHTAVWTGSEMVVWGGEFGEPPVSLDTGGRYSIATDTWTATSLMNVAHARDHHTAVWTGSEMIVWGGAYWMSGSRVFLNTGGRYCAQAATTPTPTPTATATPTATPSATPTSAPRATPTPRTAPTPRGRPTPHPSP
jgi:N-acetylneuraminic acid mutarotase